MKEYSALFSNDFIEEDKDRFRKELGHKRDTVVSAKISVNMRKRIEEIVDGKKYKTINDVVETALFEMLWRKRQEETKKMKIGTREGANLGQ